MAADGRDISRKHNKGSRRMISRRFQPSVFDLFRPLSEFRIALGWLVAAIACAAVGLWHGLWVHFIWLLPAAWLAYTWCGRGVAVLAFRMQLHASRLSFMQAEKFRQIAAWGQKPLEAPYSFTGGKVRTPSWWLGEGFEWQPSHATLAAEMMGNDLSPSKIIPPWAERAVWRIEDWLERAKANPSAFARALSPLQKALTQALYGDTVADRSPVGQSWIHALEPTKRAVLYLEAAMSGHTLIVGAPGSGKTRLYEVLTTQAIHGNNVVIVIDPKFDTDWERRCRIEAEKAGKPYLYFNLAKLSDSVRLNPIKNWNDPSEIASRIAGLLAGSNGGSDPFINFAQLSIDRAVKGLLYIGEQPTLRRIQQIVERGVSPVLEVALEKVLTEALGDEWKNLRAPLMQAKMGGEKGAKPVDALSAMVQIYLHDPRLAPYRSDVVTKLIAGVVDYDSCMDVAPMSTETSSQAREALAGLVTAHEHNKQHYDKMILTLLPLLGMLCSGEVGDTLSPDPLSGDHREIYDIRRVLEEGGVLYLGLNTLANRQVGQAIGSIILAEIAAVVGYVYNYVPEKERKQVCLFVDEAAEVVNDQFVQILNKGRGANFRVFFATQTIADFHAKMGSKALAEQILGNANNFVCLRVQDMPTRQYMSELYGETRVNELSMSTSQGTESDAIALEFRGSVSHSVKKSKGMRVHTDLLGRLRNMEFFTMIQGGTIYKCKVPILSQ
jgi:conjugal transfer pilus assembly protein TraD